MKQFSIILFFISTVVLFCCKQQIIISGCKEGLYTWYNNLLPVILPFCLLTGLFMSAIDINNLKPIQAKIILIVTGLFCGYPIGAIVSGKLCAMNKLSYTTACALMPLCNNISPMFLISIYNSCLKGTFPLINTLAALYIPQLLYGLVYIFCSSCLEKNKAAGTSFSGEKCLAATNIKGSSSYIDESIHTVCIIGIYIVIFSVLSNLIIELLPGNLWQLVTAFFEITKGSATIIELIPTGNKRTALLLSLCAFGGISAIFQSIHILKEAGLPLHKYIFGKSICAAATYIYVILFI